MESAKSSLGSYFGDALVLRPESDPHVPFVMFYLDSHKPHKEVKTLINVIFLKVPLNDNRTLY